MKDAEDRRWLLLLHQIPPSPAYLRVKIWRRLQRLGAVAVKNSVYVLPASDGAREDFQWVLREIVEGGGEASICEARFVDGLSDAGVESLFHAARDAEYSQVADEARRLMKGLPAERKGKIGRGARVEVDLARLRRKFAEIETTDVLGSPGRQKTRALLDEIEDRAHPEAAARRRGARAAWRLSDVRGRTWVTRKGIHVDRMASIWLIRRFIDPDATFKYVQGRAYRPQKSEIRFDMFEAEFTHEGERCTFEVLLERFAIKDPALRPIAEIVHDIDMKDGRFARPETTGIDSLIAGVAAAHAGDEERSRRGAALFDDLYESFRRKRA